MSEKKVNKTLLVYLFESIFIHSVTSTWIFHETLLRTVSVPDSYTPARNHKLWFAKESGVPLKLETTEVRII